MGRLISMLLLTLWITISSAAWASGLDWGRLDPDCKNGFSSLISELPSTQYEDLIAYDENPANLWKHHRRFGVIRNEDDRLILIARDQALRDQLVRDLGDPNLAKPVDISKVLSEGSAVDITDIVPPFVRRTHGVYYGGPNCWSGCLLDRVMTAPTHVTDDEFTFWLNSPLAAQVASVADLKPLDILAVRNRDSSQTEEWHGVTYLSPRLAFHKASLSLYHAYRLVDMDEALTLVLPTQSNRVDFYRMESMQSYLAAHPQLRSQGLDSLLSAIANYEKLSEALHRETEWAQSEEGITFRIRRHGMVAELKHQIRDLKYTQEFREDITPSERKDLMTLFYGLYLRVNSSVSY